MSKKIIYTLTDEAPFLATRSFLPIIQSFTKTAGIEIETKNISLASRILAQFPDLLGDQKVSDDLALLGQMVLLPETNIIKLPNISASMPQLTAAIAELQNQGFPIPNYPQEVKTEEDKIIRAKYDKVKGSAVNPVLREGNSDRRAPQAVKNYARKFPHSMGAWSKDSKSHVATMTHGDFAHSEQSVTIQDAGTIQIEFHAASGAVSILKPHFKVSTGEIVDVSFMSMRALREFYRAQITDAKIQGVLFSLHLKATMMKVSDPVIFGAAVETFFEPVFRKHGAALKNIGVNVNNGFNDLLSKLTLLSPEIKLEVLELINASFEDNPELAMVNSDQGITNLHFPNDVIVDASMPAMIRNSGRMWNRKNETVDTKAVIPDSSYASVFQSVIDYCKENGAFDPTTMGSVSNVGLMAQKAEEYGSHDKTFIIEEAGKVRVLDQKGSVIFETAVESGDIWRMCSTKDPAIQNWVKLAVDRARITGNTAIFWLNENRAHDRELIQKVNRYLKDHDTTGLDIRIMSLEDATKLSCERLTKGLDTISVTGNVMRDYLTDLFPILEVGTSAKMLSIVPLMNGGGLFETGAGGSAPKHVEQFLKENHLRWDSLGEYLALAASLDHFGRFHNSKEAMVLGKALDIAAERLLDNDKSPSRKIGAIGTRGSHYFIARYWAEALAQQKEDLAMAEKFKKLAQVLVENETTIVHEMVEVQGHPNDIQGYYHPNLALVDEAVRPSKTFNKLLKANL